MSIRERDERDPTPLPGPNAQKPSPYKFTAEEMRVLRECNRESFVQRCIPFGTVLGALAYYGVKSGYFSPSPRYGAIPKIGVAVLTGYFLGKFSYQWKCAERLMQLPNSQIGEMLRQRKKGNFQESLEPGFGPGLSLAPFSSISPADTYTDLDAKPSYDLDSTRPDVEGLDDSHRPTFDSSAYEEMPPPQKQNTTYEELRKRNREEHQQKRIGNYKQLPETLPPTAGESGTSPRRHRTNKYGDDFE